MDGLEITKPPASAATATGDVPSAMSALCCAPASAMHRSGGLLRSWISDWRVLGVAGLAVTGTGLGLDWDWLTAVGITPIIVSTAPCLIMCALGVCMMGKSRQALSGQPSAAPIEPPTRTDRPDSLILSPTSGSGTGRQADSGSLPLFPTREPNDEIPDIGRYPAPFSPFRHARACPRLRNDGR